MVRMFIRHEVADYDAWRTVYDGFDRRALGVLDASVCRSVDDPNEVTVVHDFGSEEAAREFMASGELEGAMRSAGVSSTPTVWLTTPS
jgi:heme-degrading monooxygenase HmoA